MYKTSDSCPTCITGKLSEQTITEEFEYKSQKLLIPNYHILKCDNCKEEFVGTNRAAEKTLTDFRRKIDGFLLSDKIKEIRKKLGMTQKELASKLDVAEKTFTRYENGQVTQSKAMDILLRALDSDPTILRTLSRQLTLNYKIIDRPFVPCCDMDAPEYKPNPNIYDSDELVANTELALAA